MINPVEALYDGQVFHLNEPIQLEANTPVRLIIENISSHDDESISFIDTALSLNLEGPTDWSENIDKYLYDYSEIENNES